MAASINNYTVGRGKVYIKKTGDLDFIDMGNCTEFEFTPELEKLDHYSSREGIKVKDKSIVLQANGTLRMVLDEWSVDNLKLALLGSSATVLGKEVIQIFDNAAVACQIKFTGNNDVGPKYEWIFTSVDIIPSSSINLISDEWATIELTGECGATAGSFGTVSEL